MAIKNLKVSENAKINLSAIGLTTFVVSVISIIIALIINNPVGFIAACILIIVTSVIGYTIFQIFLVAKGFVIAYNEEKQRKSRN